MAYPPKRSSTSPKGTPVIVPHEDPDFEEDTGVGTDVQVFRAVKAVHKRIDESEAKAAKAHGMLTQEVTGLKSEISRIKTDVTGLKIAFKEQVAKQDASSAVVNKLDGKMDVLLAVHRNRSVSSETRTVVTETLAERILEDDLDKRAAEREVEAAERAVEREDALHVRKVRRMFLLKVAGGVISLVTSGAVLHWLVGKL